MKAPWLPFYTGDFLASPDVQLMEAAAVGAYVLLLTCSWQSDTPGYLEDDDYTLRRTARLSADEWAMFKKVLLKKWPVAFDRPGYRFNPRLLKEAEKQVELREKKAEAGRLSAERRAAMATQRQQSVNTIPTGVDQNPTGVAISANYSQPQPQPQTSNDVSLHAGPAGKPLSESQSSTADQKQVAPAKPREYAYDEAPIFQQRAFFAFVDSIGYGHVDKAMYLLRIQTKGQEKMITTTDEKWRKFIQSFLDNDKRDRCLLLPDSAAPTTYRNPNNPAPAVTRASTAPVVGATKARWQ